MELIPRTAKTVAFFTVHTYSGSMLSFVSLFAIPEPSYCVEICASNLGYHFRTNLKLKLTLQITVFAIIVGYFLSKP